MNTSIKITQTVAAQIFAHRKDGKSPWAIINGQHLVGVAASRAAARTRMAECGYKGNIVKVDDVALEVVSAKATLETKQGKADAKVLVEPAKTIDMHNFTADGKCPKCGSSEVFEGRVADQAAGISTIVDEDCVRGCHACDWYVDQSICHESSIENPCKTVWLIADEMKASKPNAKRREILAECVARGIAYYTARTQYQQWRSIQKEMADREKAQAAGKAPSAARAQ